MRPNPEGQKNEKPKGKKLTIRPNLNAQNDHKAESTQYILNLPENYFIAVRHQIYQHLIYKLLNIHYCH